MAWSALGLQFALFTTQDTSTPDALQPWLRLTDMQPQTLQSGAGGAQQSIASAQIGDLVLSLTASPGRYDLNLAAPEPSEPPASPPTIPDAALGLAALVPYAKKLVAFQPAVRLAIIANLMEPMPDLEAAALRSAELAGGIAIPPDSMDFTLQLNIRKHDAATGCYINRLCRWQALTNQLVVFGLSPSGPATPSVKLSFGTGLVLDINTVPSSEVFDQARATAIIDTLDGEARNIMSSGYGYVTGQ